MCESQSTRGYSYMNEEAVDIEVKCPICADPFIDPTVISTCKHVFCRAGIERVLHVNATCPMCRYQPITSNELHSVDLPMIDYLNGLLVQCNACNETNIQRSYFDEHIKNLCPKVKVQCSAADLKCRWTGCRDQLNGHVEHCTFEFMRSALGPVLLAVEQVERIKNDNQELQLQIQGLQHRCKQLEMRMNGSFTIPMRTSDIDINAKWISDGVTVAGDDSNGDEFNQLWHPQGIYLHDEHKLYVADFFNHRIMEWSLGNTNGKIVAGGHESGINNNQLSFPTDVIADKDNNCLIICDRENRRVVRWSLKDATYGETIISNIGCNCLTMDENKYLYISDIEKDEVRRWRIGDTEGTIVAGGNGRGDRLNQLCYPTFVFVDRDRTVYVSDYNNHRVMKWTENAKEGIIIAGGQGTGTSSRHSPYPGGIIVDQWGSVYVTNSELHRVMCWRKGATEGKLVAGGHGRGSRSNQLNRPSGLLFDKHGNLFVADYGNHRIQNFRILTRPS